MSERKRQRRLAWLLVAPVLLIVVGIAMFPLVWTVWESLHRHDLRMPWLGRAFVGLENYGELLADGRFWSALGHTTLFTATTVALELLIGLGVAEAMNRSFRFRGPFRAAMLLPWALPTVVAGLLWRFLFEGRAGGINLLLTRTGLLEEPVVWLIQPLTAWIPIILGDVWKTTPFVALVLLAGLQAIPREIYEAAAVDGAGSLSQFWHITLPNLRSAILIALIFRTLDAFRVFDLIYVLTGGGPGTATEPIALYAFNSFFQNLRFGFGAAISVVIFCVTFGLALFYIRMLRGMQEEL